MTLEGNLSEGKALGNREAFLKDRDMLLRKHYGKCVVYSGGKLLGVVDNVEEIWKICEMSKISPEKRVYAEFVDEKAFEERPPVEISGVHEVEKIRGDD